MSKKIFLIIILISFFSFNQVYAETINTHSTMSHTKEEIRNKYISNEVFDIISIGFFIVILSVFKSYKRVNINIDNINVNIEL